MADDIEKLRKEIDALNDELAVLVQRRAGLAQRIGALKGGAGAYRPEREAAILRRVAKTNSGPLGAEPMLAVFREIISACRALEEPMRVAYLGPAGTFSEMAVLEQFGHSVEALACVSIDEAFRQGGFRASSHRPPVVLPGPPPRAHSAHRNDATPGRTPGRVAGARNGVFTAYVLGKLLVRVGEDRTRR